MLDGVLDTDLLTSLVRYWAVGCWAVGCWAVEASPIVDDGCDDVLVDVHADRVTIIVRPTAQRVIRLADIRGRTP